MDRPLSQQQEQELLKRTRRIETRLVGLIEKLGFDTPSQKPEFYPRDPVSLRPTIRLPSPHTTMHDILAAIPHDIKNEVDLALDDGVVLAKVQRRPAN